MRAMSCFSFGFGKRVNAEQRMRAVDDERARYLHQYFGKAWNDPHLYDLMISSREDEDWTAGAILYDMTGRLPDQP